ncbi:MAG: hypothetical protein GX256_00590 [Fretibacterium sp.]|nr:hypothetical protein [Fretibacterium sp.]
MSFGPEYIRGLAAALNPLFPWRVSRVEGGDSWVALRGSREWLFFSWGGGTSGCCRTDDITVAALKKSATKRAPLFEALKSRLLRGQLLSARQINRDRVLEFEARRAVAAGLSVSYFLILEATEPVANLILLDEDRKIEELARHSSPDQNRCRTLLPGYVWAPPPVFEGPDPETLEGLSFTDVLNLRGVGRPLARAIQRHWETQTPEEWLAALQPAAPGALCQRLGRYFTFFPIPLPETEVLGPDPLEAAAFGVTAPLMERSRSRLLKEAHSRLDRAIKARSRHLDGLLKQRRNASMADVFRRKGELLLAKQAEVPPRADQVVLTDWEGQTLEIALDPHLTPTRNADRYFKKYRKAQVDPEALEASIRKLQSAITELEEQKDLLESLDDPESLEQAVRDVEDWLDERKKHLRSGAGKKRRPKRKKEELPPHLRFDCGEFMILVGLSARGNRYVTLKQAGPDDLWLHAHELPGAHVIIRGAGGREGLLAERPDILEFAASLAAAHSKGKNSLSVQVDYTERRYVRSVPGTVALVTYTNPGTLRALTKPVRPADVKEVKP